MTDGFWLKPLAQQSSQPISAPAAQLHSTGQLLYISSAGSHSFWRHSTAASSLLPFMTELLVRYMPRSFLPKKVTSDWLHSRGSDWLGSFGFIISSSSSGRLELGLWSARGMEGGVMASRVRGCSSRAKDTGRSSLSFSNTYETQTNSNNSVYCCKFIEALRALLINGLFTFSMLGLARARLLVHSRPRRSRQRATTVGHSPALVSKKHRQASTQPFSSASKLSTSL